MAIARVRITERQVLLFIMAACILAYVGAILLVIFRQKGQQPDLSRAPRVRWMPAQEPQRKPDIRYIVADLLDPSLMSLPNAHGFSRRTWDRQPVAAHRPPEPPIELAFLEVGAPRPVKPLLDEPTLQDVVRNSVEKLEAEPEEPAELLPVGVSSANTTVVSFAAGLEQRALLNQPELPTIPSDAPLRPTRLRLAVAPDGAVRYAMLERTCGNETVDRQALEIARKFRFEPMAGSSAWTLTWGVAKFVWATSAHN